MSGRRKRGKHRGGQNPGGSSQGAVNHRQQGAPQNKQRQDGRPQEGSGQQVPRPNTQEQNTGKGIPSIVAPRRNIQRSPVVTKAPQAATRRYGLVFYDSVIAARNDITRIREAAQNVDQLNIVIRAEPGPDDSELARIGKVFCGAAWALIHERRKSEGWYDKPHE